VLRVLHACIVLCLFLHRTFVVAIAQTAEFSVCWWLCIVWHRFDSIFVNSSMIVYRRLDWDWVAVIGQSFSAAKWVKGQRRWPTKYANESQGYAAFVADAAACSCSSVLSASQSYSQVNFLILCDKSDMNSNCWSFLPLWVCWNFYCCSLWIWDWEIQSDL